MSSNSIENYDLICSQKFISCCSFIGKSISVALFIIGFVAAVEQMQGVTLGGFVVGLSIPLLIGNLCKAGVKKRTIDRSFEIVNAMVNLVMMILGSLAITGVLPAVTLGQIIIAPVLIKLVLKCYCCCLRKCLPLPVT